MSSSRFLLLLLASSIAVVFVAAQVVPITLDTAQWTLEQAVASILKVAQNPGAAIGCAGDQIKQIADGLTVLANNIAADIPTVSLSTLPSVIQTGISNFQASTVSNTTCLSVSDQVAVAYYQGQANALIASLQNFAAAVTAFLG